MRGRCNGRRKTSSNVSSLALTRRAASVKMPKELEIEVAALVVENEAVEGEEVEGFEDVLVDFESGMR